MHTSVAVRVQRGRTGLTTRLKSVVLPPCIASCVAGRRLGPQRFSVLPHQWTGLVPPQCLRPAGSPSPGSPVHRFFCPGTGPGSRSEAGTDAFPSVLAAFLHAVPGNAGGHAECSLYISQHTPAA